MSRAAVNVWDLPSAAIVRDRLSRARAGVADFIAERHVETRFWGVVLDARGAVFWQHGLPKPRRGQTYSKPEQATLRGMLGYYPALTALIQDADVWCKYAKLNVPEDALAKVFGYQLNGNGGFVTWPERAVATLRAHSGQHVDMSTPEKADEALTRLQGYIKHEYENMEALTPTWLYDGAKKPQPQRVLAHLRRQPRLASEIWASLLKAHGVKFDWGEAGRRQIIDIIDGKRTVDEHSNIVAQREQEYRDVQTSSYQRKLKFTREMYALWLNAARKGQTFTLGNLSRLLPDNTKVERATYGGVGEYLTIERYNGKDDWIRVQGAAGPGGTDAQLARLFLTLRDTAALPDHVAASFDDWMRQLSSIESAYQRTEPQERALAVWRAEGGR